MSSKLGNIGKTSQAAFITKDLKTGETPMFNPYDKCFYYVDIENGDIHQYDPNGKSAKKWHLDKGMVGGIVINQDGTLIGNSQEGLFAFDPKTGSLAMSTPIEPGKPNNRPNDMNIFELADGTTRIAIGCIPIDRTILKQDEKPGIIYAVRPDTLELKPIFDNHVTSNALCGYCENGKNVVFLAETDKNHTPTVWKANYNAQKDEIENVEVFLSRADMAGWRPDGASIIDVNGQRVIAIAALETNTIRGFDVDTAEPVMTVEAPKDLTLTHAAFGPAAGGETICLITSSRRRMNNIDMPGVSVVVPIEEDVKVKSLSPVAKGYPAFDEIAAGKSVEIINPEAVTGPSDSNKGPKLQPPCF
jgi:sugar lactone lactonase YvrE